MGDGSFMSLELCILSGEVVKSEGWRPNLVHSRMSIGLVTVTVKPTHCMKLPICEMRWEGRDGSLIAR
jgi:hypothetical protein